MELESLKYPIGKYQPQSNPDGKTLESWIKTLEDFPEKIQLLTENLYDDELDWIYRPEGWNIKQVVHHCADSHMHALIRFKWALTEDNPTIKAYQEASWAELSDGNNYDLRYSYDILFGVHARLVALIESLSEKDLKKTYYHPERDQQLNLAETIGNYAWHSEHHLAHIGQALIHKGRFDQLEP